MPSESEQTWMDQLKQAARTEWSGQVVLSSEREQVGTVVLTRGRIAWAVCKYQPEDLGTFLWRIGRVDRAQLDQVRARYAATGGKRKLGALLEEAGHIKRPMLRRCLLLHIRMAMGCLLRRRNLSAAGKPMEIENDDDLTFAVDEVTSRSSMIPLPEDQRDRCVLPPLEELADLDGYRVALIVDGYGQVVAEHARDPRVDGAVIGVKVATLMETAMRLAATTASGALTWCIADCDEGSVVATWLDEPRRLVAALLLGAGANVGMAKYRLGAALEHILAGVEAQRFFGGP